jgi:hypothetical protein
MKYEMKYEGAKWLMGENMNEKTEFKARENKLREGLERCSK